MKTGKDGENQMGSKLEKAISGQNCSDLVAPLMIPPTKGGKARVTDVLLAKPTFEAKD